MIIPSVTSACVCACNLYIYLVQFLHLPPPPSLVGTGAYVAAMAKWGPQLDVRVLYEISVNGAAVVQIETVRGRGYVNLEVSLKG